MDWRPKAGLSDSHGVRPISTSFRRKVARSDTITRSGMPPGGPVAYGPGLVGLQASERRSEQRE
jgi:hypothetical protein